MTDKAYKKRVTVRQKSTPDGNRMLISTHWSPGSSLNRPQTRQSSTNNQPEPSETETAEKRCKQFSSDSDSDVSVGDNESQQDCPVVPVSDGLVNVHRRQNSTAEASCSKLQSANGRQRKPRNCHSSIEVCKQESKLVSSCVVELEEVKQEKCSQKTMTLTTTMEVIGEIYSTGARNVAVDLSKNTQLETPLPASVVKAEPASEADERDFNSPPSSSLESDQLKLLSEQLCSLNADSAHITTHIHRRQTPLRNRLGLNKRQSLSTPRKCISILSPAVSEVLRSPRSTPRKSSFKTKTPVKVKFAFPATPSKSQLSNKKSSANKKSSSTAVSPLKFPTPDKKLTKRKLYTESPEEEQVRGKKKGCRRSSPEFFKSAETLSKACNESVLSGVAPVNTSWIPIPSLSDVLSSINEAVSPLGRQTACEAMPSALSDSALNSDHAADSVVNHLEDVRAPLTELSAKPHDDGSPLKLEIAVLDNEQDIDASLEEMSEKIKLTATNVRSIIHQLITNEHVQDLVRNTLLEQDGNLGTQLKEAIFEPKMTRSKLKEVIGKGQVPLPSQWALSPMKPKPSFLDLSFPDDDDDEEYRPTVEELEPYWSDDESVVSSQASDLESPRPSSSTPRCRLLSTDKINGDSDIETPCKSSPIPRTVAMGPPSCLPFKRRKLLNSSFDTSLTDEECCNIALRTRSKLPLNDTPLDVIESSFIAPDITADLYDEPYSVACDDDDWKSFLGGLFKQDAEVTDDDEVNDPEYNVMDELEEYDAEEIRNDKATRISKKEVNELWKQFFEEFEHDAPELFHLEDVLDESQCATSKQCSLNNTQVTDVCTADESTLIVKGTSPVVEISTIEDSAETLSHCSTFILPLRPEEPLVNLVVKELVYLNSSRDETDLPVFTDEEKLQLQVQMRKHVQLLAQTFVQATLSNNILFSQAAAAAKHMLIELNEFASNRSNSYFLASNLREAVALTERSLEPDGDEDIVLLNAAIDRSMSKKMYRAYGLTYNQMRVLLSSPVFIYPEILPESRFIDLGPDKPRRVGFSSAEDVLLAIGMEQFGDMPRKYNFIQTFLLPTKTWQQIMFRFKNCKNSSRNAVPIIRSLITHSQLPEFPRFTDLEPESSIVAPIHRSRDLLPNWFTVYEEVTQKFASKKSDAASSQLTRTAKQRKLAENVANTCQAESPVNSYGRSAESLADTRRSESLLSSSKSPQTIRRRLSDTPVLTTENYVNIGVLPIVSKSSELVSTTSGSAANSYQLASTQCTTSDIGGSSYQYQIVNDSQCNNQVDNNYSLTSDVYHQMNSGGSSMHQPVNTGGGDMQQQGNIYQQVNNGGSSVHQLVNTGGGDMQQQGNIYQQVNNGGSSMHQPVNTGGGDMQQQGNIYQQVNNGGSSVHQPMNTGGGDLQQQVNIYQQVNNDGNDMYHQLNTCGSDMRQQVNMYSQVNTGGSDMYQLVNTGGLYQQVNTVGSDVNQQVNMYQQGNTGGSDVNQQVNMYQQVNTVGSDVHQQVNMYQQVNTVSSDVHQHVNLYQQVNADCSEMYQQVPPDSCNSYQQIVTGGSDSYQRVNTGGHDAYHQMTSNDTNTNLQMNICGSDLYRQVNTGDFDANQQVNCEGGNTHKQMYTGVSDHAGSKALQLSSRDNNKGMCEVETMYKKHDLQDSYADKTASDPRLCAARASALNSAHQIPVDSVHQQISEVKMSLPLLSSKTSEQADNSFPIGSRHSSALDGNLLGSTFSSIGISSSFTSSATLVSSSLASSTVSNSNTAVILTNVKMTSSIVVNDSQFMLPQHCNAAVNVTPVVSSNPVIVLTAAQLQQLGITVSMLPLTTVSSSRILSSPRVLTDSCNSVNVTANQSSLDSVIVATDATHFNDIVQNAPFCAPLVTPNKPNLSNDANDACDVIAVTKDGSSCSVDGSSSANNVTDELASSAENEMNDATDATNSKTEKSKDSSCYEEHDECDDGLVSTDMDLSSVDIAMLSGSPSPPPSTTPTVHVTMETNSYDNLVTPKKIDMTKSCEKTLSLPMSSVLQPPKYISQAVNTGACVSGKSQLVDPSSSAVSEPSSVAESGISVACVFSDLQSENARLCQTISQSLTPVSCLLSGQIAAFTNNCGVRSLSTVSNVNSPLQISPFSVSPMTLTSRATCVMMSSSHSRTSLVRHSPELRTILPGEQKHSPIKPALPLKVPAKQGKKLIKVRPALPVSIAPKGIIAMSPVKKTVANITARARRQKVADFKKEQTADQFVRILPKQLSETVNAEQGASNNNEPVARCGLENGYVDMPLLHGSLVGCPVSDEDITGQVIEMNDYCEDDDDDDEEVDNVLPLKTIDPERSRSPVATCVSVINTNSEQSKRNMIQMSSSCTNAEKEESDKRFAERYLLRVCNELVTDNNAQLYVKFLQLLTEFRDNVLGEQSAIQVQRLHSIGKSAMQLYKDIRVLLSAYPDLVSDFSGFLLPGQAVECNCFMDNFQFTTAAHFIDKLRMYVAKFPSRLLRVQKVLKKWSEGRIDNKQLKDSILPLIRSNAKLSEEFLYFFDDTPPSCSNLEDYEQVVINDDEDCVSELFSDYEKVDVTAKGDKDGFGTAECPCQCHAVASQTATGSKPTLKHCHSCALKVIRGRLYLQTSERILRPATAIYHSITSDLSDSALLPQQQLLESSNMETTVNQTLPGGIVDNMTSQKTDKYCSLQEDPEMTSLCYNSATVPVEGCNSRVVVPIEECSAREMVPVKDCSSRVEVPVEDCNARVMVPVEDCSETLETPDLPMEISMDGSEVTSELQRNNDVLNQQSTAANSWTREEDRILLEVVKTHGPSPATFEVVRASLNGRSVEDVVNRFNYYRAIFESINENGEQSDSGSDCASDDMS